MIKMTSDKGLLHSIYKGLSRWNNKKKTQNFSEDLYIIKENM